MIKKTITFQNLDGEKVTQDFYFAMSLNETLTEAAEGTLIQDTQQITQGGATGTHIYKTMTAILSRSVGRRSEDGSHLIKTPEFTFGFMNSDAFSVLLFEMLNNADKAAEFFTEIFPANLADKVKELQGQGTLPGMETPVVKQLQDGWLEVPANLAEISDADMIKMPQSQFNALFGSDPKKWSHGTLQAAFHRRLDGK